MIKLLLTTAAFGLMLAHPVYAMDALTCDTASMTKMQGSMDAITDPAMKANKDMAMKHMQMAQGAMKDKKMDDCSAQMGMAKMNLMLKCDDASMAMMQTEMDKIKDPAMKTNKAESMKHMELAKASMKANKNDECMTHMDEAMGAMFNKM